MLSILIINVTLCFFQGWYLRMWGASLMVMYSLTFLSSSFSLSSMNMLLQSTSLSNIMVILACFISFLMILCSNKLSDSSERMGLVIMLLNLNLVLVFCVSSMFSMYFFFEFSLIPTLILILSWGYQPERMQAGIYLMLYTFTASMPLLVGLIGSYSLLMSSHMPSLSTLWHSSYSVIFWVMVLMAFLVKLPIYLFHLWLPKAHVEAPLAGSMVLAGTLLKLGGYGLYQMYFMFSLNSNLVSFMVISLAVWGGVLTMLVCYRQSDMKSLIAYSSVGHMGVMLAGMMIFLPWGLKGAIMVMVAHGLCSSALFCLASFTYEKSLSRSLPLIKGVLAMAPNLTLWWFIFASINMSTPPSLNLLAEILIFPSVLFFCGLTLIPMGLMVFLAAVYNMYLYTSINHGKSSNFWSPFRNSLSSHKLLGLFTHAFPMLLIMKSVVFY